MESPNKKEKQQKWQAAKEANASMESDDSMSKHTFIDVHIFRQVDYLWLFNDKLKFSERKDFVLEDAAIPPQDMLEMHVLNRMSLTEYFRAKHSEEGEDQLMDHEWADENIDEEIKEVLSSAANSADMPLDIVAHMEYFYNTLDCHFKT